MVIYLAKSEQVFGSHLAVLKETNCSATVRNCRYDDQTGSMPFDIDQLEITGRIDSKYLAQEFGKLLRAKLGTEKVAQINLLNVSEEYDDSCSTHDFLDANQVMCDALSNIGLDFHPDFNEFINTAWKTARQNNFKVE